MSDFTGYRCWTPHDAARTIATEAVSPSAAVFVATHAPLDIRRVTVSGGQVRGDDVISEPRLLREFLTRPTNNGVLVVPVLGASGAGKSHLVRWVHENMPPAEQRRVIYLPKESTSLAGVVDKMLLGLTGAQFDDIRRDVGRLGGDITQESLERRLLDELAESLRVASPDSPRERALVGEQGLYLLLHDPFFRSQLLREGSLVRRRAAHAISGRGDDEPDVPLRFTEDDLPTDVTDIREAGVATQRLFRSLVANDSLRAAAVELLNRHLDIAVMQAANLGVGRLHKAFLEIRRVLAAAGEEIVLLVEDFALVQGIQRDLLDAILETGEREGRTVLAPIRTLLAVTTGYYESLVDTVRTRIESSSPFRYELRVTLGQGAEHAAATEQRVVDFVGRYLNAARIGRDRLDDLRAADAGNVPNACDTCPMRERCHPAFGTASTGHGLYPYNREALLRAVRSSSPRDEPDSFNPRAVLARVVRHVLTEYADDVERRHFPNARFAAVFPPRRAERVLPAAVARRADASPEPERRRVLLEFWGGTPTEFRNLAPGIHDAFAIPLVADADADAVTPEAAPVPVPTPEPVPADVPPRVARRLRDIDDWHGRADTMPQEVARELRRMVHDAVVARITWTDPATRQLTAADVERAWPATAVTISIEDARENRPKSTEPTIRFARSPENAVFFQDLVRLANGIGAGTLAARLRLDELAERYAPVAKQAALEAAHRSDAMLVEALRVSLAGAATCGVGAPGDKVPALLSAVLTAVPPPRADGDVRSPRWQAVEARHREEREAFVRELRRSLGAAQGTGEVDTIDAVRAARLLKAASASWLPAAKDARPRWSATAAAPLAVLADVVDEQLAHLTALVADVRARLPRGTGFAETAKAVQQAIEAGEHHGYVPVADVPALKARNAAATAVVNLKDLERLEHDLATLGDAPFEARLAGAPRPRGPGLGLLRRFLVENDAWLDDGLARADFLGGDEVVDLVTRVSDAVKRWREAAGGEA